MPRKRRTEKQTRLGTSKRQRRAVSPSARASARRAPDLQARAYQVFAEQADSLWNDLADQCRQFANGFNQALGSRELHVEAEGTTLLVAYPRAEAVLRVALDKTERYVQATLDTGCAARGTCAADQPVVGLTVNGNDLRFVLAGEVVSNERLVVALLTKLTSGTPEEGQSPPGVTNRNEQNVAQGGSTNRTPGRPPRV
jgi:hypothetical protein